MTDALDRDVSILSISAVPSLLLLGFGAAVWWAVLGLGITVLVAALVATLDKGESPPFWLAAELVDRDDQTCLD